MQALGLAPSIRFEGRDWARSGAAGNGEHRLRRGGEWKGEVPLWPLAVRGRVSSPPLRARAAPGFGSGECEAGVRAGWGRGATARERATRASDGGRGLLPRRSSPSPASPLLAAPLATSSQSLGSNLWTVPIKTR